MNTSQPIYTLTQEEVYSAVDSQPDGLTTAEANERLASVGKNALPEPQKKTWLHFFFAQFKSFLIVILLVAAAASFVLDHETDAYIILAAVLINVIVGFIQEMKADRALDSLKQVITREATVLRDGAEEILAVAEIVPGDIVLLNAGDTIPADGRVVHISDLQTNEAALTGESAFIEKSLDPVDASAGVGDRTNMVFTGTTVTKGSATIVVTHTGVQTEIGKIAKLLHETKEEATPLQKRLDAFARLVGIVVLAICAVILIIGMARGVPFVDIFITAVAIAVSAIPEGLVVAVTIILAIGMQRVLKRNALVRNLQAAETLGSTSVICTDKTGTLTEGNMQVVSLVTSDYHFQDLHQVERHEDKGLRELIFALNIGMICNDAHVVHGDSGVKGSIVVGNLTERALLTAGMNLGLDHKQLHVDEPRLATIPFDSKIKYMATLNEHPSKGRRIYVKGAPEKVIDMCDKLRSGSSEKVFSQEERQHFNEKFIEFSESGLRILGLAYKDMPKKQEGLSEDDIADMTFVGFVGIKDPLRPNVRKTFERTAAAGIHTVMITGDHKLTAQAIAKEVGLPAEPHNVLEGEELHAMTQEELNARVQDISVYARVSPEDKLNIIKAWQSHDNVVAMTGDGVNDSPALKAADIGVALGSGTDVAKETADMVLLDDQYDTIVAAVEEGRGIFANIRKIIMYLMSDSFSEMIIIAAALLFGIPLPLVAAQILWINLVGDTFPAVALTIDPKEKDIMYEKPRSVKESVMTREMKLILLVVSIVSGVAGLFMFGYVHSTTGNIELARTVVFTALALDSLPFVFAIRSLRHSLFSPLFFSNRWLLLGVGASFVLQLLAIYFAPLQQILGTQPLGFIEWGIVAIEVIGVTALVEILKYVMHKPQR